MPGKQKTAYYDKSSYGVSIDSDNNMATAGAFFQELIRCGYRSVILLTHDVTREYDTNQYSYGTDIYKSTRDQILFSTEPCVDRDIINIFEKHYKEVHGHFPDFSADLVVRKIFRF